MLNKKVYIISVCLKKHSNGVYDFHFRGWFEGRRVTRLRVQGGEFEPCDEYLISAKILDCQNGVLICEYVKAKAIFNC
ncbi:MAG: hypothetical protein KC478_15440 [Bacteriovoracaceae bacterium]|nr:hypothetical protein [Bacteriovoracaceae bacterium]